MKIKVKSFATFRELVDKEMTVELEQGAVVSDLLNLMTDKYPKLYDSIFESEGVLLKFVNILINGRNIEFLSGLNTIIKEDDIIALFPPAGGG